VDREYRDAVLAVVEDLCVVAEVHRAVGTIGNVDEAAAWMHVDRTGKLTRLLLAGSRERRGAVLRAHHALAKLEHRNLVLALDRHEQPRPAGMEVHGTGPESIAAVGRDGLSMRELAVAIVE